MVGRRAVVAYACAVAVVIGVGSAVLWPTLELGLEADDYMAIAIARGEFPAPRHALDAFAFARGGPSDLAQVQRLGTMPWWTPPDFRLAFLRPLASALWHVDLALFGRNVWWYHAHSLAVWAALAIAAGAFYRQLLSWRVAALACAIFALDQSQHMPVQWLSNRGGLYAVLFGVLGLRAHVEWRKGGGALLGVGACVSVAVGLLFGEWALPMLAYFFAYELIVRREALARRDVALLPVAVVTLAFLVARAALGYGARGSGVYVDPTAEPLRFAAMLAHRIPVFIADMAANLPAQWWDHGSPWRDRLLSLELIAPPIWGALPDWRTVHVGISLLTVTGLWALLRDCMRAMPDAERRTAGFLLLGALLALVPVAGSFPSTRLTLAAMFGGAATLAMLIAHLLRELVRRASGGRCVHFAATWLLLCGTAYAQLVHPLTTRLAGDVDYVNTARHWVLSAKLDDQRLAGQRVMMLSSGDFITTYFWAYTWRYHRHSVPRSFYPVSSSPTAHDIERPEPNVLVMRPLGALLLESPGERMFRAPELTWLDGQSVQLPGMRVRVEGVRDGCPTSIRLTFDVPVDDPSLVFLESTKKGLTRATLPRVGETLRLPAPASPSFVGLLTAREEARFGPVPEQLAYVPTPWFVDYRP